MKKIAYMAVLALCVACSGHKGQSNDSPYAAQAREHGQADAINAVNAPSGSMEQEQAVLQIRANEQALVEAGDSAAAHAYIEAAREILVEAGLIENR